MTEDHKDLPLTMILSHASLAIERNGGPKHARVFFKYTCEACGARQTFEKANTCYDSGECAECGKVTKIKKYGYMLVITRGGEEDAAEKGHSGNRGEDGGEGSGSH